MLILLSFHKLVHPQSLLKIISRPFPRQQFYSILLRNRFIKKLNSIPTIGVRTIIIPPYILKKINAITVMKPIYKICYCTIMSAMRGVARNAPSVPKNVLTPRRFYAGRYKAKEWDESLRQNQHKRDDLGVTKHEATHTNVIDTTTNKSVGILTSAKGNKLPPEIHSEKIDSVKYNGKYIPLLDPKTNKPLLDANGNEIPNQNKGGQFLGVFGTPRVVSKDATPLFHEKKDHDLQTYLDKHENKIASAVETGHKKTNAQNYPAKKIGGKDDEPY